MSGQCTALSNSFPSVSCGSWDVYENPDARKLRVYDCESTHSCNQSCIRQLLPKVYETEPVTQISASRDYVRHFSVLLTSITWVTYMCSLYLLYLKVLSLFCQFLLKYLSLLCISSSDRLVNKNFKEREITCFIPTDPKSCREWVEAILTV